MDNFGIIITMKSKEEKKASKFTLLLRKYFRREDVFKIPNIICYLRMILVIGATVIYLVPFTLFGNSFANVYIASDVMVVASFTDFLDGFVARSFDQRSNLGKVLDPIADILTEAMLSLAVCVMFAKDFPIVILMLLMFLLKEVTLVFEDIILAVNGKSFAGARVYGKISTFVLLVEQLAMLIFGPALLKLWAPIESEYGIISIYIFNVSSAIVTLVQFVAWLLYLVDMVKILKSNKSEISEDENQMNVNEKSEELSSIDNNQNLNSASTNENKNVELDDSETDTSNSTI